MVFPSEGFDPTTALECVGLYKTTMLYGVPTMFISMLHEYEKHPGKYDVSTLRSGFISGSGCPEILMQKILNTFASEIS